MKQNLAITLIVVSALLSTSVVIPFIYPPVDADDSQVGLQIQVLYADGSTAVASSSYPLSITYHDKEIEAITVNVNLYLEFTGQASDATFSGTLQTIFNGIQRRETTLNMPSAIESGKTHNLGQTTVTSNDLNTWISGQVGTYPLTFKSPQGATLTLHFADTSTDTKTFGEAIASLEVTYQSDSKITIADISIESGTIEPPPIPPITTNPKWYGYGCDYLLGINNQRNPSIDVALDRWDAELPLIQQWGFNTIRLSGAFQSSGSATHSTIDYNKLDAVIAWLDQRGVKVVLNPCHNWQDMTGFFGSPEWIQEWVTMATHYKNDRRIVGFELFNEPFPSTWHSSITGGGAGRYDGTRGVEKALAQCVDAIRATGDQHAIVYPDPWYFRPSPAEQNNPSTFINSGYYRDNIVVTIHQYCSQSVTTTTEFYQWLQTRKNVVDGWFGVVPVWHGEIGVIDKTREFDRLFCIEWINWVLEQGQGFNFWSHGYSSRSQFDTILSNILERSNYQVP